MRNNQIIKTDKFITDYASICRVIPFSLLKENPALVRIYCILLLKSLPSMQGVKAYHDFMHENYSSIMTCSFANYNDLVYLGINITTINKKYLPEEYDAFPKIIEKVKEAFYSTPIFNNDLIERNKKELITYIKNNAKNPGFIAYQKSLSQVEKDNPVNFDSLGSVDQVEQVTLEKLLEFHQKISKYPFSIVYQGNNEFHQYELLKKEFNDDFELPLYKDSPFKEHEYIYGEENLDTPNTCLAMVYRFVLPYNLRNNMIMRFYDQILGGQNSILFDQIREKKGLCYSIYSAAYSSENIVQISTSISKENLDYTIKSIDEIVSNFEKYCTKEYFETARMDIISEFIERIDCPSDNFRHNITILRKRNRTYDYQEEIDMINQITYEEIIEFSKNMKLISTYAVKGER